jgi:glycine dehydrogenase subunit 1
MATTRPLIHPYIPNSVPSVRDEMLEAIGTENVEGLFESIPDALRLHRSMDLPAPFVSEQALQAHVDGLLSRNKTSKDLLSFLGAGCYRHYVPAVCDEVNGRGEFLTAYAGEPYDDHGRFQALFEYASMMGELLEMDVVNVPTYDGLQASATSLRMAARMTGRRQVLIAGTIGRDRLSMIRNYCAPDVAIELLPYDRRRGSLDLAALADRLTEATAAVYFENPSYLGFLEEGAEEIAAMAHRAGAECVVGVDPISLGILAPPIDYGADIVCGDLQPLGMHVQFGGGHAGFIATRDEVRYVRQYPSRLFGVAPTREPGEFGFGDVAYERTSFAVREKGNEWVGTASALWGITAGVYMALMGPQGFREIGEGILQRSTYASDRLAQVPGVRAPLLEAPIFQEFVANFDETGKPVVEILARLLDRGIFGGKDLSGEFPELGQSALICITEMHTQADIDRLAATLEEVVR